MRRAIGFLGTVLLLALSFGLYQGVYSVKAQEKELKLLDVNIATASESIRVLKAEWSYLNQPERLQTLARRHLTLVPTATTQIVILANLPERSTAMPQAVTSVEPSQLPFRDSPVPARPAVRTSVPAVARTLAVPVARTMTTKKTATQETP